MRFRDPVTRVQAVVLCPCGECESVAHVLADRLYFGIGLDAAADRLRDWVLLEGLNGLGVDVTIRAGNIKAENKPGRNDHP